MKICEKDQRVSHLHSQTNETTISSHQQYIENIINIFNILIYLYTMMFIYSGDGLL